MSDGKPLRTRVVHVSIEIQTSSSDQEIGEMISPHVEAACSALGSKGTWPENTRVNIVTPPEQLDGGCMFARDAEGNAWMMQTVGDWERCQADDLPEGGQWVATNPKRQVAQVHIQDGRIVALANDGTLWYRAFTGNEQWGWDRYAGLPAGER